MSTIKPNNFPLATLPLSGGEEVYSQKNDISEKYLVEDIKNYVLTFLTGGTDIPWVKDINGVHNITDNIGIGTITPTETLDVKGTHKMAYDTNAGTITQSSGYDSNVDSYYIRWNVDSIYGSAANEIFLGTYGDTAMRTIITDVNTILTKLVTVQGNSCEMEDVNNPNNQSNISQKLFGVFMNTNYDTGFNFFQNNIDIDKEYIRMNMSTQYSGNAKLVLKIIGDGLAGFIIDGLRIYTDDNVAGNAGLMSNELYRTEKGAVMIKL